MKVTAKDYLGNTLATVKILPESTDEELVRLPSGFYQVVIIYSDIYREAKAHMAKQKKGSFYSA